MYAYQIFRFTLLKKYIKLFELLDQSRQFCSEKIRHQFISSPLPKLTKAYIPMDIKNLIMQAV